MELFQLLHHPHLTTLIFLKKCGAGFELNVQLRHKTDQRWNGAAICLKIFQKKT